MKSLIVTFWAESLKTRKSNIFWITIVVFIFLPFMMGFLMWVSKNPELASKLGLIGTKARLYEKTDWPTYFQLLNMIVAAIGLIGFGFVTSWVFGYEYAERTVKDLLALPVSRFYIVISKLLVVILWCILLSIVLLVFGHIAGAMVHMSGWTREFAIRNSYIFAITSIFTIISCTPVAFFASFGRGYILPMGFVIFTMALAQFSGILGLGQYFPWAIPGLFNGAAGPASALLSSVSYIILFSTSIAGLIATILWWRYADQT